MIYLTELVLKDNESSSLCGSQSLAKDLLEVRGGFNESLHLDHDNAYPAKVVRVSNPAPLQTGMRWIILMLPHAS